MIWNKPVKVPIKKRDETLTEFTEKLEDWYTQKQDVGYRKGSGQYFTPKRIAEFMVGMLDEFKGDKNIKILDPGAGVGIFESIICERLPLYKRKTSVTFDLYENSEEILPLLELNMKVCRRTTARNGINISYRIIRENFILTSASSFSADLENWERHADCQYDAVICNPPYYKLKKDSAESLAMRRVVKGQPNVYVLFMAMATRLLRAGGQFVFLTPRSYCSGTYFKEFRKWFLDEILPLKLHVFGSRKIFKKDRVLQEMVILKGCKGGGQRTGIIISSSHGEPDGKGGFLERRAPIENVVVRRGSDIILRIPITEIDDTIGEEIDQLPYTLSGLGLKASTGPLVPFRAAKHLLNSSHRDAECAPLIWMENIVEGKVIWPVANSRKAKAINVSEKTKRLTIPNGNYVMIKRFSTKEGKRRINAGVLLEQWLGVDLITIENHVNYIYKVRGKLTVDEAYGLREILNSKLYNRFFQMSNGSTQVDASAINSIPLPALNVIARIGRLARKDGTQESLSRQRLLMARLGISPVIVDHLLDDSCSSQ